MTEGLSVPSHEERLGRLLDISELNAQQLQQISQHSSSIHQTEQIQAPQAEPGALNVASVEDVGKILELLNQIKKDTKNELQVLYKKINEIHLEIREMRSIMLLKKQFRKEKILLP